MFISYKDTDELGIQLFRMAVDLVAAINNNLQSASVSTRFSNDILF